MPNNNDKDSAHEINRQTDLERACLLKLFKFVDKTWFNKAKRITDKIIPIKKKVASAKNW